LLAEEEVEITLVEAAVEEVFLMEVVFLYH
jgi:hypothetical protein